ncbi:MAG: DinB family protein [Acidobacteriota bacterium]
MDSQALVQELNSAKEYFDRSTRCLTEDDSTFAPSEGSMTTAQQVAHVAQTVDWFFEGAFRPEGFSMDFEAMGKEIMQVESLAAAREWLDRAFAAAIETTTSKSAEELSHPLPEGPIMGGAPRFMIVSAIQDHTAHHRGVLTVHSRLRGYTPVMPYMEGEM